MKIAILKIILWPKETQQAPRVILFSEEKINIITGESATGKSTLTSIIDYCLGSEKCSIPVGLIREVTAWFGLHLQLANTEMIVARRNPEDQQSTSDLYWAEGLKLSVPATVVKNARVDDLKNRFNQISHLPSLDFSSDENVGFGGRPSFRDMAAFNFQPQHIVANPYTLFYKADTTEHREKLRVIFPLVLGSIDANTLAKQREMIKSGLEGVQFSQRFRIPASTGSKRVEALWDWYASKAREKLVPRVRLLARQLGVDVVGIKIVGNRYRWGSCTLHNNVNLNWRLIKAPMFVIDYVIVHELAHLIEANHTQRFWNVVRAQTPTMDKAKAWLKEHGQLLEQEI